MSTQFNFTPEELAEQLTISLHHGFVWQRNNGYITDEQYEELTSLVVVMPIPNKPGFGKRVLNRLFGKEAPADWWVFPIMEVPSLYSQEDPAPASTTPSKPKLTIVKG